MNVKLKSDEIDVIELRNGKKKYVGRDRNSIKNTLLINTHSYLYTYRFIERGNDEIRI